MRQVGYEGGTLLAFVFLIVMKIAFTDKRRGMDAMFPLAHKLGFDIINYNARELGFIGDNEFYVFRFIHLIGPG